MALQKAINIAEGHSLKATIKRPPEKATATQKKLLCKGTTKRHSTKAAYNGIANKGTVIKALPQGHGKMTSDNGIAQGYQRSRTLKSRGGKSPKGVVGLDAGETAQK